MLELPPGERVVRVRRVRTADGEPLAIEEAFLPAERFAGIEEADFEDTSLFELLDERWGVRFAAADQRVVGVEVVGDDANLLRVAPGRAGLLFHTTLRDDSEQPLCYAWSLFRGDRYEIRLRQHRGARRRWDGASR
jgi:GntR family transcriptional regulator